jgi:hypothetical protein
VISATLAKVLPVTLHIVGLSVILLGGWSTPVRWMMGGAAKRTV